MIKKTTSQLVLKIFIILFLYIEAVQSVSLLEAYEIRKRVRNDLDAPRHIYRSPSTIASDLENSPSLYIGDDGEFHVAPPLNRLKQYLELAKERLEFERSLRQRHNTPSNI